MDIVIYKNLRLFYCLWENIDGYRQRAILFTSQVVSSPSCTCRLYIVFWSNNKFNSIKLLLIE